MSETRHGYAPGSQRRNHSSRRRAFATPAVLVALIAGVFAAPAPASHAPVANATFPGSNWRCSSGQKSFLKAAWQEAYVYTSRAKSLVDYIAKQPTDDERKRLWEQDFRGFGTGADQLTTSPQRYFGAYDHTRLGRIRSAFSDARRRYEGKTMYLITCSTVCAKKKSTSANHAVRGRIVTCSVFWSRANNKDTYAERLAQAAFTLAHEVFHHIFVKVGDVWAAIGDYHGDGVGGHSDENYYGIDDVTYLARKQTNWAVRNNDTYAYFAQKASVAPEESFTSVAADKERPGTGGIFRDLTLAGLKAKKTELAATGQYLADVETYVRGGQRLYAALWRIGAGDGVFAQNSEKTFRDQQKDLERKQDLIDVELFRENGAWKFIGVYRVRAADAKGVGALQVDLGWKTVFDRQQEYAKLGAYLADVETYVEGAKRKYLGLWRVGGGAGALANTSVPTEFGKVLIDRLGSQQLIDIERYVEDGAVYQIGVWRYAANGHGFVRGSWDALIKETLSQASDRTLIDIEENSNVSMEY